jgi:hypothetical protein
MMFGEKGSPDSYLVRDPGHGRPGGQIIFLAVKELPNSSGFELHMTELKTTEESDVFRRIWLDLTNELRTRFGDTAVQMKQH